MSEHTSSAPAEATSREWLGLAVIALPCMVYAMDMTVLNLALPVLSAELRPSAAQLLWMVDIYSFLVAGFLITMGNLGDRIGRRKLLLIGAAAFGLASLIAAYSTSAEMLIAMRALLGVAGATLAPSTMSLIRNMFHDEAQRRFAIGVWIASFSMGAAIGPLVGGALLQWFHWGSVFLVAVPVMVLLLVLGPLLLPEFRDPEAGPLDLASALLSLAAVLAAVYGIKTIATDGLVAAGLLPLLAGVALGWVFVRRQSRLAHPLLDIALFRQPRFAAALSAYALSCLAMFGIYIFITQYLQVVRALDPLSAGLVTLPWALAFVVGSLGAPRLAGWFAPVRILVGGQVAAVIGFLMLLMVDTGTGLPWLVAGTVIMSLGMAPVFTLGNEIIITSAPPERAGAASALSETASELSGALGVALLGSLGVAWYQARVGAAMPAALPAPAADAARDTLAGALHAAKALGGSDGPLFAALARGAFVESLHLVTLAGAAVIALACLTTALLLMRRSAVAAPG
ncbi:MAG: MFS transporter [Comamonadaceae bacterium]|jgi:DHA2 family multidrug resistance protein-like MFS transporter|uniref:MFS transporter n=1 Tax=Hydrogenophaga borbori TaxID=2294117 RepID=A0A372EKE2_9BURK|nr:MULTISPECIES: MFS transporter [Hydrogenophaga]NCT97819.1 MFS transporter [Comamonadaceae bacterium]RFP79382.1 MFS transporter [Hydrogenophaga borbori]WQB84405.1 MFS transporter [Hydrogenophaga sp. SNF1]